MHNANIEILGLGIRPLTRMNYFEQEYRIFINKKSAVRAIKMTGTN